MVRSGIGVLRGPVLSIVLGFGIAVTGNGCGGSGGNTGTVGKGGAAGGAGGRGGGGGSSGGGAGTGGTPGTAGATGGSAGAAGGSAGAAGGSAGAAGSVGGAGVGGSAGGGGAAGAGGAAGTTGVGGATGGSAGAGGSTAGAGGSTAGAGGGTAGTGGSAGGGGTGGGCTPTGPESCFNGLDDDCNGLVDCNDPACNPIAECVRDATGFQFGTTVDQTTGCPAHFVGAETALNQSLNVPPNCAGCTVTPVVTCSTTVYELAADMCPNATRIDSRAVSSDACTNNAGAALNWTTSGVHVDPMVATAACVPAGTPSVAPLTWRAQTKFCGTQELGGGCAPGYRCLARLAPGGKHCVAAPGTIACPASYTAVGTLPWYSGVQDTRDCGTTCTASAPSTARCGTSFVRLYLSSANCTGTSDTAFPGMDTCALDSPLNSIGVVLSNPTAPTCTITNSFTGGVTPTGPETLCCL